MKQRGRLYTFGKTITIKTQELAKFEVFAFDYYIYVLKEYIPLLKHFTCFVEYDANLTKVECELFMAVSIAHANRDFVDLLRGRRFYKIIALGVLLDALYLVNYRKHNYIQEVIYDKLEQTVVSLYKLFYNTERNIYSKDMLEGIIKAVEREVLYGRNGKDDLLKDRKLGRY